METAELEVVYYTSADGKQPFRRWFGSLKDRSAQAKVQVQITRLRLGNFAKCKSVGKGVMEIKIDYGPGYRIYVGRVGQKLIMLLSGGDKSTQDRDIKLAQNYWDEYRRRHG